MVDEGVDGAVGGLDLALEPFFFVGEAGGGEGFVQGKHGFDEGNQAVMLGDLGRIGKID